MRLRSSLIRYRYRESGGVGAQTQKKLDRYHIRTIGDLRQLSMESLKSIVGVNCEHFYSWLGGSMRDQSYPIAMPSRFRMNHVSC